jgi:hypothetical protein
MVPGQRPRCGLDDRIVGVRLSVGEMHFSLLHSPPSGYRRFFSGGKADGACSLPFKQAKNKTKLN